MKFHTSLITELVRIFETHGGHREEWRLKSELAKLDATVYTQHTGKQVIVSTRVLNEQIQKNTGK